MNKISWTLATTSFFLTASAFALDPGEQDMAGQKSGTYDYLVYAVTWQPTFCLLNASNPGCKNYRADFYTHGIWPYFKTTEQTTNKHPSICISSPGCSEGEACNIDASTLSSTLKDPAYRKLVTSDPSGLMQHEWKKHGTCYGKNQTEYFNDYKNLRNVVHYKDTLTKHIGKTASLKAIQSWFPSNTSFRCASINGKQYLFEVFYLINKDGSPFHQEKSLQIGERCTQSQLTIPDVIPHTERNTPH
ncbi:hypothetical protein U6010_11155 [Pseudomonas aeruginosa]|uniref:ribonuclease T2 family protein n=1 Tax=Pseudomonas aeruginosa TaxID=287 RepID=UPI002ADE1B2D|nr:hypothetical protein [Pseudomonas aeruginosa]MEA0988999.1 hypothetical protein [Pseudomonas aeruginosa]HCF3047438.1 hypothetical protein [Pseudomonas aeruginosa]HCL3290477.1 hypothetical protein [Pseudomonas aeruginosa]